MTLRHIVCWKMNGVTAAERAEQVEQACAAIAPLDELIPTVQSLSLHRNELHADVNYDLVLIADFADAEGLAVYAAHPEHQPAIQLMKTITASRVAIDFTV